MRIKIITALICIFSAFTAVSAEYEKACPNCNFVVMEKAVNKDNCTEYYKYFFENQKIGKAYESFAMYFVPNHKYGEFWKRYFPESKEKYYVNKEHTGTDNVSMFYDILPKEKHVREGKRANIEMLVNNIRYYFELREVTGGTEITACYSK